MGNFYKEKDKTLCHIIKDKSLTNKYIWDKILTIRGQEQIRIYELLLQYQALDEDNINYILLKTKGNERKYFLELVLRYQRVTYARIKVFQDELNFSLLSLYQYLPMKFILRYHNSLPYIQYNNQVKLTYEKTRGKPIPMKLLDEAFEILKKKEKKKAFKDVKITFISC